MPQYVQIAVNVPTQSGAFDYNLPPELADRVRPGHLVTIPFGAKIVQGVILRFIDHPAVSETKAVLSLVDADTVLTLYQLELAGWMSNHYLAPLSTCVGLMIPPGLEKQADTLYTLNSARSETPIPEGKTIEARLVRLLAERGPLRGRQIESAFHGRNWRDAARRLELKRALSTQPVLMPPSVRPKYSRTARLACSAEEARQFYDRLGRAGSTASARRRAMLEYLIQESRPVETAWLFAVAASEHSGPGVPADIQRLEELGLVSLGETENWRDPLADLVFTPSLPPRLTPDQRQAVDVITHAMQSGSSPAPILLHGVTGSGKTEIYLQAANEALRQGKQVVILVPEIGMTPQIVHRFGARFAGQVGLVHSNLSEGERYDTWRRARQGDLSIIVGPRSALFVPLERPGLIIVDECHDDSYHNGEFLPYYHARETAAAYARLSGALCLLGSATPDIVTRRLAEEGQYQYIHLPARILAHRSAIAQQMAKIKADNPALKAPESQPGSRYRPLDPTVQLGEAEKLDVQYTDLPPVQIVDMRLELQSENRSIFSRALQSALKTVFAAQQQAILFINRRGTATYVFCRSCGYVVRCPRCDTPLTYHTSVVGDAPGGPTPATRVDSLLCHRCGYARRSPSACPNCQSNQIRQFGTGAEKVEAEVQQLLPEAHVLRLDYDTTRQKDSYEIILRHFSSHQADVLVGTQMIAKGLDLPLVTLVGAVLADVGLQLPDLRAAERTFQLLTQVAGRAGRSPLGGQVILQTFQPDNYVIQNAARHDYESFYEHELSMRRSLGYPPFARLVRLEYRSADNTKAEQAARRLAGQLQTWLEAEKRQLTELIGPAPCFFARQDRLYRWQIILRGPDPAGLLRGRILEGWKIEVDPPSLL